MRSECLLLWPVLITAAVFVASSDADQASFDCKMRQLAMDYARKIQPWLPDMKMQELADALNGAKEAQHCNVTVQNSTNRFPRPPAFPTSNADSAYYVDTNSGSDSNSGAQDSPFKTITKAVTAARTSGVRMIILRKGTFYLADTIMLNEKDSGLTIQNYPNEEVVISGGTIIKPIWQAADVSESRATNIYKADLSSQVDSVMGLRVDGARAIRARYPNANPETDGFASSLKAKKWLPPTPSGPVIEENPDNPSRSSSL